MIKIMFIIIFFLIGLLCVLLCIACGKMEREEERRLWEKEQDEICKGS